MGAGIPHHPQERAKRFLRGGGAITPSHRRRKGPQILQGMTIDATLSPCTHHAGWGKDGWCNDCVHACAVSDRKRTAELERKLALAREALERAMNTARSVESDRYYKRVLTKTKP